MEDLSMLMNGGPMAAAAYAIVYATKRWVPPRFRALAATAAGILASAAYNAYTGGDWAVALQTGLAGGLAATGMHETISKGIRGDAPAAPPKA